MRATRHGPVSLRSAYLLPTTFALVGLTLLLSSVAAPRAWGRGTTPAAGIRTGPAGSTADDRQLTCSNGSYTTIFPCSQGGSVPVNSTGLTLWYHVQNSGFADATYGLSCSYTAPVTSCDTPQELDVNSGSTGMVALSYSTGASPGTGSVTLSLFDLSGGDHASVTQSITVSAPTYTVAVTPDNGAASADANSTSNTYAFTVRNNGSGDATYSLTCSNTKGSCSLPGGSSVFVSHGGGTKSVSVTYQAGAAGTQGTVTLTASHSGYSNAGSIIATAYSHTVTVTPTAGVDGQAVAATANQNNTVSFTIENTGTAQAAYSLTKSCPGTTCSLSVSSNPITLNPGVTASASVTYHAGADLSTGSTHLRATYTDNSAVTDDGWITWTAHAPCQSQSADADLTQCTHARQTVLTNATGIMDTLTLASLSGAPLQYTLACDPTGPVTCSASGDGTGSSSDPATVVVTTHAGASDGNGTARVVVTTGGGQVAASFPFEVLSPTGVVVSTSTTTTHLDAGQPGSHTFTVHNAGTLTQTFRLDTVCTGIVTQCERSATQVTLGAGASTTVTVSYVASNDASRTGTVGLTATHVRSSAVTSTATAPVAEDRMPAIVTLHNYSLDYRNPSRRFVNHFNATASYTTPAYTSLDVARAVTLVYSSALAAPRPVLQADVTDSSAVQAEKFSLRLQRPNGSYQAFANDSTEMFFENAHQVERLAVQLDTTALLATGAYPYTLIVTSYWDSTTHQQVELPVRAMVDNEQASPYGAGWGIAGLEQITPLGDSALITDGTGAAAFFRRQSCSGATCTYLSPAGDFSTLTSPVTVGADGIGYTRRAPDGTTVAFTPDGREAYAENRFGTRTSYGYDTSNRLITITDPVGQTITLHYTTAGTLDYIEDPMGRRSTFTITGGNLTQITDPAGGTPLTAAYDAQHRLIQLTDRAEHVSNLGYDFAGKLAADTLPTIMVAGAPARPVVQYASPEITELVDPSSGLGNATSPAPAVLFADVFGTVTDPRGNATRYWLTRFGSPWQITEPLGRVTNFSHTNEAQLRGIFAPSGHQTLFTWSGPDLIEIDQNTGQTVHFAYEPVYHQVDTVSGDATPVINYWSSGKLDSTLVGGSMSRFIYDSFGRVLTSTDPMGHVDSVAYAPSGLRNRTSVTVAGRTTTMSYDVYGRVVTAAAPDSGVRVTQYDPLNRVQMTVGPVSDTTVYTYGDSLHLTAVRDALGQVYQSTMNALGWATATTDPTGHSASVGYDLAGNVVTTTDRAGQVVTATYDSLNHVASVTADGTTTTFHTDPRDRFQAVSNAASTDTVRFDVAGRPDTAITWRGTHHYVRASTYDDVGLRTTLAISGGWSATIRYAYDPVTHQLDTLTDVAGGKTVLGYNGDQQATTVRLPTTAGLTVTTSYPSTHTPSSITYSDEFVNQRLGVQYSYTPTAQVAQRSPAVSPFEGFYTGREFQYDSLQRLVGYDDYEASSGGYVNTCDGTQWVDADGNWCGSFVPGSKDTTSRSTFAYDPVGNRTDSGAVTDSANRLLRFGGDTLIYDLDGNLVHRWRVTGGFEQTFGWNSLGQLVQVVTNGDTVRFAYDGFGRRVSKTSSSDTTGYLYDGQNLLAELDATGNRVAVYTYYPGIDQPHSVRRWVGGTPSMYYYARELPNNVVGLIDSNNVVVDHYVYTPFGRLADSSGTVPNSLRFGAREFDQETGLYYNRARFYDPTLGRFISEDPIGLAGGMNLYTYASDDPINRFDPTGTCDRGWWVWKIHNPDGTETWVPIAPYAEGDDCGHEQHGGGGGSSQQTRTWCPSGSTGTPPNCVSKTTHQPVPGSCPNVSRQEYQLGQAAIRMSLATPAPYLESGFLVMRAGSIVSMTGPAWARTGSTIGPAPGHRWPANSAEVIHSHPSGAGISPGDITMTNRTGIRSVSAGMRTNRYGSYSRGGIPVSCDFPLNWHP